MRKRLTIVFLTILMLFSGLFTLSSCKDNTNNNQNQENNNNENEENNQDNDTDVDKDPEVTYISCSDAVKKAIEIGDEGSDERFKVKGKVKEVHNAQYGEMTIYDETGELYLYGTYSADGSLRYSEMNDKPYKGDDITVNTLLNTYKGEPQGKSSWIVDFKHNETTIEGDYLKTDISKAREVADGTNVEITGTVAFITYGQKNVMNGFYLIDDKDSIYVYDSQVTPRVKVGNKVTIKATKNMFIAENEKANAEKFGYTGSCQVSDVHLVSNDGKENAINLDFASDITVKSLLNKPLGENYRTKIYKVNAYINKVPGQGFTNYYINDLDNETGSYVYTSNNGNDFSYLDKFDGKICTIYLSVINMKSSTSGCVARFIPIKVEDNNYQFDLRETNQFVLEYVLDDLFKESYDAGVTVDLITSYNNENLGIEKVSIKYESLTPTLVTIDNNKAIFNNSTPGIANIKVTITHNSTSLEHTFNIEMKETPKFNHINIKDALNKVGEKVILKGVAGPSLTNQTGFYLIDDTGAVSVRINSLDMAKISFGNLITIQGTVIDYSNKDNATNFMRLVNDAELLLNENGNYKYSDKSFVTDLDYDSVFDLQAKMDALGCAQVYRFKGFIKVVENGYSTNIFITNGAENEEELKEIMFYNNGARLDFLKEFASKEVTIEFAYCNYNNKATYNGACLSVEYNGKTVYNLDNYNK